MKMNGLDRVNSITIPPMNSFVCIDTRGIHSPLAVIDVLDEDSCNSQSQLITDL